MKHQYCTFLPRIGFILLLLSLICQSHSAFAETAYLEITLKIDGSDRPTAVAVYKQFREPFLTKIIGAKSKQLLIRDTDVQVLHTFASREQAEAYLRSDLFSKDVVGGLKPLLKAEPEIRIYSSE